jgi:uncharacterized Tic20 family protein
MIFSRAMEPLPPVPGTPGQIDKTLAVVCHLSLFFFFLGAWILVPLIIFLLKKDSSPWVGEQAREVLNFHISLFIYAIVCAVLVIVFIGAPLLLLLGLASLILPVIGAIRAAEGILYRYPLTIRVV